MSRPPLSARTLTSVAAAVAASLVLTACSETSKEDSDPTRAVTASDEGMQRYYDQDIAFGACADFATNDDERTAYATDLWECGRLEVPLDYDDPAGKTAKIAVLRSAAQGEPIGSLVVNPGGPGGTGTSFAATLSTLVQKNPISKKFDIVGFDPRGTGASTPGLDCFDDAEREADAAVIPFIAGGERFTSKDQTRDLAATCADRSGGEEVLATSSTRNVARDLDVLRAVLGDDQLTYLGDSWGTRLGAVYAEMYPDEVRAMILDGGLDPNKEWSERALTQFTAFQDSFEAVAKFCADGSDCPLGDDPEKATDRFLQLVRPLGDDPLPAGQAADGSERVLTPRSARDGVIAGLYLQDQWPDIVEGLRQLRDGRGEGLLALRDGFQQRSADGSYNNFLESTFGVYCADEDRLSPKEATRMRGEIFKAAPFMDVDEGLETRDGCESWPAEPTLGFPYAQDIEGLPELMVISVTGDPATPYEDGVNLAKTLGASLLTVEGNTHGVTFNRGNACIDAAAADYLINLEPPAADARCTL